MAKNSWNDFAASGKVSDYLKYRRQECRMTSQAALSAPVNGVGHGTKNCPDRHRIVCNACR